MTEADYMKLPMKELARRIDEHLKRFELDPAINKKTHGGLRNYFWAGSHYSGGARLTVSYINYQGHPTLTKPEAAKYLQMLDSGFVGRHYEALRK